MIVERHLALLAQLQLHAEGFYHAALDGQWGPKSNQAYEAFKKANPVIQATSSTPPAPATPVALPKSEGAVQKDAPSVATDARLIVPNWPHERDVPAFFGEKGTRQTLMTLPYPMFLAWDKQKEVPRMSCHVFVAPYIERILKETLKHYGPDRIKALGLDLFGGCLNVRKMRGGNSWSMHSWGIAVDLDPDNNELHMGRDKARFAKPEYHTFWNIVESVGAVSLGRTQNYDWMHFQFAKR